MKDLNMIAEVFGYILAVIVGISSFVIVGYASLLSLINYY